MRNLTATIVNKHDINRKLIKLYDLYIVPLYSNLFKWPQNSAGLLQYLPFLLAERIIHWSVRVGMTAFEFFQIMRFCLSLSCVLCVSPPVWTHRRRQTSWQIMYRKKMRKTNKWAPNHIGSQSGAGSLVIHFKESALRNRSFNSIPMCTVIRFQSQKIWISCVN